MCVKIVRRVTDGKEGKENKSQVLRSLRKLLEIFWPREVHPKGRGRTVPYGHNGTVLMAAFRP